MRVSTDDAPRHLTWHYMGPAGKRWPAASPAAYATFIALVLLSWTVVYHTVTPAGLRLIGGLTAVIVSFVVTWRVFRFIDNGDRTISYFKTAIRAELTAPRPPKDGAYTEYAVQITPDLFDPTAPREPRK